jgi:molybdopterin synthase catalytic subunit/molybdopterin converting factor small subunit
MRVRVLFFGVLREAFAGSERWFEVPGDSCAVHTLLAAVRTEAPAAIWPLWPTLAVALNQRYARADDPVLADDEVALLPPVSGGSSGAGIEPPRNILLTHAPLDFQAAAASLKAGDDGAVVLFDGIVRNNTRGRATLYLVYEAYEQMAVQQMQSLVDEAQARFAVRDALLHHRLGRLEVGETSVLIAVTSAHRAAAFEACRWLIDTLKAKVPIWKKEHFVDGAVWTDGEPFPEALLPGAMPSEPAP